MIATFSYMLLLRLVTGLSVLCTICCLILTCKLMSYLHFIDEGTKAQKITYTALHS